MKDYLIFEIYVFLQKKKSTTAKELSKAMEISSRSVYRYIDSLSLMGVPIITKTGRNGGIELIGSHYIDCFLISEKDKEIIKNFIDYNEKVDEVKNVLKKLI